MNTGGGPPAGVHNCAEEGKRARRRRYSWERRRGLCKGHMGIRSGMVFPQNQCEPILLSLLLQTCFYWWLQWRHRNRLSKENRRKKKLKKQTGGSTDLSIYNPQRLIFPAGTETFPLVVQWITKLPISQDVPLLLLEPNKTQRQENDSCLLKCKNL